jgi:hypothetical protein
VVVEAAVVVVAAVVLLSRFPFGYFWNDKRCVRSVCVGSKRHEPPRETGALHRRTKEKPTLRITQPAEPLSKINDQISPTTTYTTIKNNSYAA